MTKEEQLIEEMREEYIGTHRHYWTMHQEADYWIEKLKLYHQQMTDEFWRKRNEDIKRSDDELEAGGTKVGGLI